MKKARVIITQRCSRGCSYCVNKHEHIRNSAVPIGNLGEIPHREELIITGGEPMEVPFLTHKMILDAKAFGFQTIYLYTALYTDYLAKLVPILDGVQLTVHSGATREDAVGVYCFQNVAWKYPDKSFRLALSPDIKQQLSIVPSVWTGGIRSKLWRTEDDCCVPAGETLYILKGNL